MANPITGPYGSPPLDNLDRDDGSLGPNWSTPLDSESAAAILSHAFASSSGISGAFWATAFKPDCEVWAQIASLGDSIALWARVAGAGGDGYYCKVDHTSYCSFGTASGGEIVGGTDTWAAGDWIAFAVSGTTLELWRWPSGGSSWEMTETWDDDSITTGNYIGAETGSASSLDNFGGGLPPGAQFRAAGAKAAGTTGQVTVGAPSGIATGDLEVLIATTIAGGSVSITDNGGSAWTALSASPKDVTLGEKLYIWWRIRQVGDGDPKITPGSDHSCACRLAYQADTFDADTPIEIDVASSETTSDKTFSWAPGTTPSENNCLIICVATSGYDSNTAQVPVMNNASLTGLASRANYETSSGGGGGFGVTEGLMAKAANVGTFACSMAQNTPKAYISFAIRPLPVSGSSFISKVSGVADASISKISSVSLASVGKVAGLAR
jgi:hypothetical protein